MQRPFGTNTVRGRFSIHQVQIHEPNRGIGHNLWHMKQAVSCNGTQIPQWDTEQEGAFDTCEGAPLLVPVAAVCKYLWIPEREIPTWKTSGLLRHILIEPLGHETDSKSGKFYSTSQEPANPNKFQHALEFTAWYGPRALSYNYFQNMGKICNDDCKISEEENLLMPSLMSAAKSSAKWNFNLQLDSFSPAARKWWRHILRFCTPA